MISKAAISKIKSLEHKKYRQQYGLFIAEGRKIITEVFHTSAFEIIDSYLLPEAIANLPYDQLKNIPHTEITYSELERISQLTTPNFGLLLLRIPEQQTIRIPSVNELLLVLDSIRDPGNMGTIVRLCDWFGVKQIVCSEDTVDFYSPKVIQATMGSFCRVNVSYTNLSHWLKSLPKHIHIYGTVLNGEPLPSIEPKFPAIVIVGSESHGISSEVLNFLQHRITIPGDAASGAESLNAAIATGIVLYEFGKNRSL